MVDATIVCDDKTLNIDVVEYIGFGGKRYVFVKETPYVDDSDFKNILLDLGGAMNKVNISGYIRVSDGDYISVIKMIDEFMNRVGSMANEQYLTLSGVLENRKGLIEKVDVSVDMADMKVKVSVEMILTEEVIS